MLDSWCPSEIIIKYSYGYDFLTFDTDQFLFLAMWDFPIFH